MADDNQNQQNSNQLPIDVQPNWHFKSLVSGNAAYPGQPLAGHTSSIDQAAIRRQAASDYAASQAQAQAKHDAQVKRDQAPPTRKKGKR